MSQAIRNHYRIKTTAFRRSINRFHKSPFWRVQLPLLRNQCNRYAKKTVPSFRPVEGGGGEILVSKWNNTGDRYPHKGVRTESQGAGHCATRNIGASLHPPLMFQFST